MTVETTGTFHRYKPGSAMAAEPLPGISFEDSADLRVYLLTSAADPVLLTEGTDYAIGGSGENVAGTIRALRTYPSDYEFWIERATAPYQRAGLTPDEKLPVKEIERTLDRTVRGVQDIARDTGRALFVQRGDSIAPLPSLARRKGQLVASAAAITYAAYDENGDPTIDTPDNFAAPAKAEADRAKTEADQARNDAGIVEGALQGLTYASVEEGEAKTSVGAFFLVPIGTTPETYTRYQRTAGGSVVAAPLATTSDLASVSGAERIGTDAGGTVAQRLSGAVALLEIGSLDTPANAKATLLTALVFYDNIIINPGIYDPIDFAWSNRRLVMQPGVVFRLPDGTVAAGDTDGPKVVEFSGDNITVVGDFTVDGNKANNDASSFTGSVRRGSLHVSGHNVRFEGTPTVNDAYWKGFYMGDSDVAGEEARGFYAKKIIVNRAYEHSGQIWSAVDWRIDEWEMSADSWDAGRDHRLRTGTANGPTAICRGSIGVVRGNKFTSLIMESKSQVSVDINAVAGGGKIEDAKDCYVGKWEANDCSEKVNRVGFGMINCENCHVGPTTVRNFDHNYEDPAIAVMIIGNKNCSAGPVTSTGNKTNGSNAYELRIRGGDGFHLKGQTSLVNPVGTCRGFFYDHGYPPQKDIVVDSLVSRGHDGWDVNVEDKTAITIREINSDAVAASAGTTAALDYPAIRDKDFKSHGEWAPTYTTSGTGFDSVTPDGVQDGQWDSTGREVFAQGAVRTDAIVVGSATGNVLIGGLPFNVAAGANENPGMFVIGFVSGFAGQAPIEGVCVPGTKTIALYYRSAVDGSSIPLEIADLATGANANLIRFGVRYVTDEL